MDPVLAAIIANTPQLPGDILVETTDIPIRTIGSFTQTIDIYARSASRGPRAALLCLHGGGWRTGSPKGQRRLARFLAWRLNLVVMCPSYRLVDVARFPAQIQDAANAMRWLRSQAAAWSIDPHRVGVGGSSAGGYLAAMVALTGQNPDLAGGDPINEESCTPQAVVVEWGPLDFIARWYGNGGRAGAEAGMLDTVYTSDPTLYHYASALAHMHAGAPPALFVQGRHDRVVHVEQAELGHAAWIRHGVAAELCLLDAIGHGANDAADVCRAQDRIADFLSRHLTVEACPGTSPQAP